MPDLYIALQDKDGAGITLPPLTDEQALAVLRDSAITASKLVPWGSNYTFAVALTGSDGREHAAIYKPRAGEAPLYDFPDGTLYQREVAAYRLSHVLGWVLVPPTEVRQGPHGVGSLQLYVEPEPDGADLRRFWGSCHPDLERLVLFDHLANNADRKMGHLLRDRTGHIWGIDHGLTFNRTPKLRTVLWQFVGERISPALLSDLESLRSRRAEVQRDLGPLLERAEIEALFVRLEQLLRPGRYPNLNPRRNVPYGWW